MFDNEADNLNRTRTERHAYANLVRTLGDELCHYSINANRGEKQRQTRKRSEQCHVEAMGRKSVPKPLLHGFRSQKRHVAVD